MSDTKTHLLNAARNFSNSKIIVIGDIMIDVYEFYLNSESKPIDSEKKGKRAYKSQHCITTLGGSGNVAVNLASLGASAVLMGLTGNDEKYFKVKELANELSIQHFLLRDDTRPTTTKTRIYIDNEYMFRRDDEKTHTIDTETAGTLLNELIHELHSATAVILSDYNKGMFTEENAQQIITECNKSNVPVIVDFKPMNRHYFKNATILCPNRQEAASIVPSFSTDDYKKSLTELYSRLHSKNVIVTLGSEGMCGYDGTDFFHIGCNDVTVADEVGCGDTVRAVLALGITNGLSLKETASLANDAAAVIVQKEATACLSSDELSAFIENKY
jgi:D-beta-D-heptose 7-phosphate kinase/D-beta-D-heptose 1-phosphate adenosyltransferase